MKQRNSRAAFVGEIVVAMLDRELGEHDSSLALPALQARIDTIEATAVPTAELAR